MFKHKDASIDFIIVLSALRSLSKTWQSDLVVGKGPGQTWYTQRSSRFWKWLFEEDGLQLTPPAEL